MTKTLTVIFDGHVFRPEGPVNLKPNARYKVTVQSDVSDRANTGNAWNVLSNLTGSLEAPEDWSNEHNHYLYGTAKRSNKKD